MKRASHKTKYVLNINETCCGLPQHTKYVIPFFHQINISGTATVSLENNIPLIIPRDIVKTCIWPIKYFAPPKTRA